MTNILMIILVIININEWNRMCIEMTDIIIDIVGRGHY